MRITILVENRARRRGILGEHGLSLLIEVDGKRILFDAGQTDVLLHNAENMGVKLTGLDAIVLSHGHYDHSGSIPAVCRLNPTAPLYMGQGAFACRFNAPEGVPVGDSISIPWSIEDIPETTEIFFCDNPMHLSDSIIVSGRVPRDSNEPSPKGFVKNNPMGRLMKDVVEDEIFLTLKLESGIVIITGCSHSGIINIIEHGLGMFDGMPLRAVVGGFHLEKVNEERLTQTLDYMETHLDAMLIPMHCTGVETSCKILNRFHERTMLAAAGDIIDLE